MLIEGFQSGVYEELEKTLLQKKPTNNLYLFLDGAFVPKLHERLSDESKDVLFSHLLGCNRDAIDASPFITPIIGIDKSLKALFRFCNGWPMVNLIETPEPLAALGSRLSAWCIVEVSDQRFNFRFMDTRRLGVIFDSLTPEQKAEFAGPALQWKYISRSGAWEELELQSADVGFSVDPILDDKQFAKIIDDSKADEVMMLLSDRGHDVFSHPFRSHALVSRALQVAFFEQVENDYLINWCEYFWVKDEICDIDLAVKELHSWRT